MGVWTGRRIEMGNALAVTAPCHAWDSGLGARALWGVWGCMGVLRRLLIAAVGSEDKGE